MIRLGLVGRTPASVNQLEKQSLQRLYGEAIQFVEIDPKDDLHHDILCDKYKVVAVVFLSDNYLPPIPMDRNIPHLTLSMDGSVNELVEIIPRFRLFDPGRNQNSDYEKIRHCDISAD